MNGDDDSSQGSIVPFRRDSFLWDYDIDYDPDALQE